MQKLNIYIDHTLTDEKFAYSIQQILNKSDNEFIVNYYSQVKETSLENWESIIPKLLSQADIVLIIVSNNYLENFLTSEVTEIINSIIKSHERFVFPIVVEELDLEVPFWLSSSKSIELHHDKNIESEFNELNYVLNLIAKIKLFYTNKIESINLAHIENIRKINEEIRKNSEDKLNSQNQIASFKSRLIEMLSQNKIEEIIKHLNQLEIIKRDLELKKNLINCSSRFYRLNGLIRSGTLSQDEIFIESNKINDGLFDIINSINENISQNEL